MELEKDVEKYFKSQIQKYGGESFKWTSTVRGVPDQIVILPKGKTIFVEMKKSDGHLRRVQHKFHQKLREKDQLVFTCFTKAGVDELVCNLQEWGWLDAS